MQDIVDKRSGKGIRPPTALTTAGTLTFGPMKRIISLLLLLGLAATYLTAQTTLPAQPSDQETLAPDLNGPAADEYTQYATQSGLLLIKREDQSHLQMGYKLYPQPAERFLAIDLQADRPVRPVAYLTDLDGKRLNVQAKANTAATKVNLTLDVRQVKEGMYYLVVLVPGVGSTEGMPVVKLDAAPVLMQ